MDFSKYNWGPWAFLSVLMVILAALFDWGVAFAFGVGTLHSELVHWLRSSCHH